MVEKVICYISITQFTPVLLLSLLILWTELLSAWTNKRQKLPKKSTLRKGHIRDRKKAEKSVLTNQLNK